MDDVVAAFRRPPHLAVGCTCEGETAASEIISSSSAVRGAGASGGCRRLNTRPSSAERYEEINLLYTSARFLAARHSRRICDHHTYRNLRDGRRTPCSILVHEPTTNSCMSPPRSEPSAANAPAIGVDDPDCVSRAFSERTIP